MTPPNTVKQLTSFEKTILKFIGAALFIGALQVSGALNPHHPKPDKALMFSNDAGDIMVVKDGEVYKNF